MICPKNIENIDASRMCHTETPARRKMESCKTTKSPSLSLLISLVIFAIISSTSSAPVTSDTQAMVSYKLFVGKTLPPPHVTKQKAFGKKITHKSKRLLKEI